MRIWQAKKTTNENSELIRLMLNTPDARWEVKSEQMESS